MRFFLPSAKSVFERLVSLDKQQGEILTEFLGISDGKIEDLALTLGIPEDLADELVQYTHFLQRCHDDKVFDFNVAQAELERVEIAFGVSIPNKEATTKLLSRLLEGPTPEKRLEAKKRNIQRGIGDTYSKATSLVDARPVFNNTKDIIETWVIGCTLRIEFENASGEEKVISLDVDNDGLKNLRQLIDLIEKKKRLLETAVRSGKVSL